MKIVVVSAFYSAGMGYSENCLPKSLASIGHDVHLVASDLNVYGNTADYDRTYRAFLGPAKQPTGCFEIDGYTVHRLPSRMVTGYVYLEGLAAKVKELDADIVHSTEVASLQTFVLAALKPFARYKLFTETHQHMSVVKPFLKKKGGHHLDRMLYRLTRTAPTALASLAIEKCYAIAPDCAYVAEEFYGVPRSKIGMQSLGTDTDLFHPATDAADIERRTAMRAELGYGPDDIVCIYTGRFSKDKNPLALARAIDLLADSQPQFRGLFVGEGVQKNEIEACRNSRIVPFMTHKSLAEHYRLADIAVWPTQESMSMLDASASGLPLIVSNTIGEYERVEGNGAVYQENDSDDLARTLQTFADRDVRVRMAAHGRQKMVDRFSWRSVAQAMEADYRASGVA